MRIRHAAQVLLMVAILAAGAGGCTRSRQAKKVAVQETQALVTEYVSRCFNVRSAEDRKGLAELLGGEARTRLEAWSDTEFIHNFVESRREFVRLAFRDSRPENPDAVQLTYELTYFDRAQGKDIELTTQRLARLLKTDGMWRIHEVEPIRENVEFKTELAFP